ncbi:MAG: glycosyltransferase [Thermosipho sp. (in: Bacteria)]|nr:glycosyltransferase [Thermosipho sp. (in: thermotogales)]
MVQTKHILPSEVMIIYERKQFIAKYCKGKRVLHLGCVDSGLTEERMKQGQLLHAQLAKVTKKLWVLDIDKKGIDLLKKYGFDNLVVHDLEKIDTLDIKEEFDVIVASEVLEHLSNPGLFLKGLYNKFPNCELIITVPNAYSWVAMQSMVNRIETVHEDHKYYFSYQTLKTLLESHGFKIKKWGVYTWIYNNTKFQKELSTLLKANPFWAEGLITIAETRNKNNLMLSATKEQTEKANKVKTNKSYSVISSNHKTKIAFWAGDLDNFHFINDYINYLQKQGYEIRKIKSQGLTQDAMFEILKWSDISWFEWANGPLVWASKFPKVCKIICRLHKYEAYTEEPRKIDWNKVDYLLFVSNSVKETFNKLHGLPKNPKILVIPNAINLERYNFTPKEKGFDLAWIGRFHPDKNLPLLLQCFIALLNLDNRYKLHLAGRIQNYPIYQYFEDFIKKYTLHDRIFYYGEVKDIFNWLIDKHYIVLTSIIEGHPVGVMEAMAMGLKPIIHRFAGYSEELFPPKYTFVTIEEFIKQVMSPDYNPSEYRNFIEQNYNQEKQFKIFNELIKV